MVLLALLSSVTVVVLVICKGGNADEYGSYADSSPPFHYEQRRFTCPRQHKRILWDTLAIAVHQSGNHTDCGISVLNTQRPEIWGPLDKCLNGNDTSLDECTLTPEYGVSFKFDQTKLTLLDFPCITGNKEPEITAIHIIYSCADHVVPDDHGDDIMTLAPELPPIPPIPHLPPPLPTVTTEMPVTEMSTMQTTTTSKSTTESTTKKTSTYAPDKTTKTVINTTLGAKSKKDTIVDSSHPLTADELGVIVGPSVAALVLVVIAAIAVFIVYKRKQLKMSSDLQGESLFYSRRFSTASQLSDISLNTQPVRVIP